MVTVTTPSEDETQGERHEEMLLRDKPPTASKWPWVEILVFFYIFGVYGFSNLQAEYYYFKILREYQITTVESSDLLTDLPLTPAVNTLIQLYFSEGGVSTDAFKDLSEYINNSSSPWEYNGTLLPEVRDHLVARAGILLSCSTLLRGVFPIVMTTFLLAWGDVRGRKLGLILPCVGGMLRALFYLLIDKQVLGTPWLLAANGVEGLFGYRLTLVGTGYAYLADIVPEEARLRRFTIYGALIILANALASFSIGYVTYWLGWFNSFTLFLIVYTACAIYAAFIVPESLQTHHGGGESFSFTRAYRQIVDGFKIFFVDSSSTSSKTLVRLMYAALTFYSLASFGVVDIDAITSIGPPLYLDTQVVGCFLLGVGLAGFLGLLLIVPLLEKCGVAEPVIAFLAAVTGAAGFIQQGFAHRRVTLFTSSFWFCLYPAVVPLCKSVLSTRVTKRQQGKLQASVGFMESICECLSTPLLCIVFAVTVTYFPGGVFVLISCLLIACGFLCLAASFYWRQIQRSSSAGNGDYSVNTFDDGAI